MTGTLLAEIRAGGTLAQSPDVARPAAGRRVRLLIEIGLLFLAAPILVTYAIYGLRVPLFLALLPVLGGMVVFLLSDRSFRLGRELATGFGLATLVSMLALFVVAGGAIALWVAETSPRAFLAFPRQRTGVWLSVLMLYPVLSVLAQELVFRTFFFHRYGPLFGDRRWLAIASSGVLFGYAHIMFYNPVAVLLTTASGCLFAWRYVHTRSFWAVFIEHTLYGWLIFTVGLGGYFFTGIANPRL